MANFLRALFLHLNTSLWSLAPVLLLVLTPTAGWGWFAKVIAVIWIVGVHITFVRSERAGVPYLSGTLGGYLLSIPLLALALWLEPGVAQRLASIVFAVFNLSCLFLVRKAIAADFANQRDA